MISLIIAAIASLVWLIGFFYSIAGAALLGAFGFFFIGDVIFYLIWLVVSVLVLLRIWKMYKAVNAGDIATLKATNNILWSILALIFSFVIPGILLILADPMIKQL